MSEIRGIGTAARHFTPEEEAALRADASTAAVMAKSTKVQLRGDDLTYRAEKADQQSARHLASAGSALELGHAGLAAIELVAHLPIAMEVLSPIVALVAGAHGIVEAHHNGASRADALAKDTAHVALLGALDLPDAYRASRLAGDYAGVSTGFGSPAFKMGETLRADPKAMAVLQLHADRGMRAARDLVCTGGDVARLLAQNPKLEASYRGDAAFKEGFDAYRFAATSMPPDARTALDAKLDARDGWYAQAQVQMRM